ncbi:MAG TPA: hypothetical protein VJV97_04190, partial [Gemmatimonadaceae bacterium]|nr:hypothetical protein [Gemmatimonadaceae bacterium]
MSDDAGVLEAAGRIGTAGVLDAAARTESEFGRAGGSGVDGANFRILNATFTDWPATTVTLSS